MILEHTFEEETHIYKVPGQIVLSTSDVISLNGLSDYGAIPKATLDHASWRGTQLHKAIQYFEEDNEVPEMPDEVFPYFRGYLKFRADYDFEPIGELEKQIVYVHEGTEQPIGCTIDLRGMVKGQPYILDAKTAAGWPKDSVCVAKRRKLLAWRLQLASYMEATCFDRSWLAAIPESCSAPIGKAIVHVNKDAGYEFHEMSSFDDSFLWDGAVRMAVAKLAAGFQVERR